MIFAAMKRLQDMGASYFILDLRDNRGGLVQVFILDIRDNFEEMAIIKFSQDMWKSNKINFLHLLWKIMHPLHVIVLTQSCPIDY